MIVITFAPVFASTSIPSILCTPGIRLGSFAVSSNSSIKKLIEESEIILKELSWDYKKGREYLQREFNVSTRKELDEQQLLIFIENLKSIRNQLLPQ